VWLEIVFKTTKENHSQRIQYFQYDEKKEERKRK
jgi:hypothetical protein